MTFTTLHIVLTATLTGVAALIASDAEDAEELRRRAAEGLAILMASSDVEDLLASCDRVIVLRDGIAVAELAGREINKPAIVGAMEGVQSEHH